MVEGATNPVANHPTRAARAGPGPRSAPGTALIMIAARGKRRLRPARFALSVNLYYVWAVGNISKGLRPENRTTFCATFVSSVLCGEFTSFKTPTQRHRGGTEKVASKVLFSAA